jgi:hypothetical protein
MSYTVTVRLPENNRRGAKDTIMLGLWILLTIIACGLAIQGMRLLVAARRHSHSYKALLERIMRVRLHKMLQFLGANQDEYLRTIPAAVINQEIYRCARCKTQDICDSILRDGQPIANMTFCPNYKYLIKHSLDINHSRTINGI